MYMKKTKLVYLLSVMACVFSLAGCNNKESNNNQTYDGRVFDISVNQDKSLTATSTKSNNYYQLEISGSGKAVDYNKKESVPWNPIIKKINSKWYQFIIS